MPSRFFTGFILLFWAVTSGWFFFAEFWPRLRGGDPPPFTIDLADEARKLSPSIEWEIIRGGEKIGRVATTIQYRDGDDSFELSGTVHDLNLGKASFVRVSQMINRYRVTREGQLLAVSTEAILRLAGAEIQMSLDGQRVGNSFHANLHLDSPFGKREIVLEPVPMSARGSALNPLHPVDRIRGLSLGMSWRIALVDPVRDALANLVPGMQTGPSYLQARVLPQYGMLEWAGQVETCYVIQYSGESVEARTWVRASDSMVLRQEARLNDDELVLERVK
jgi:hypothetical protein